MLQNRGHIYEGIHNFKTSQEIQDKLNALQMESEENLQDKTIEDYFGKNSDFYQTPMWICFHSMLAFKPYHSLLEMNRYMTRFALTTRIEYLEGILHTKRNEYDSIVKPIMVCGMCQ